MPLWHPRDHALSVRLLLVSLRCAHNILADNSAPPGSDLSGNGLMSAPREIGELVRLAIL